MKKIKILHLSDLHITQKSELESKNLIEKVIDDVTQNLNRNGKIDLIIFTGDLVNSGKKENFELAFENVISPLIDNFSLTNDDFIYIPGNHEVDISKILEPRYLGLDKMFTSMEKAEEYEFEKDKDLYNHLLEYLRCFSVDFKNDICCTKIIEKNGLTIGLTLLNTAWLSKGNSEEDVNKLFIPKNKIIKSYKEIEKCDLKICLMHHPYDFFRGDYKLITEKILTKYSMVISGHIHDSHWRKLIIPGNSTLFLSGNEIGRNMKNSGYSLYDISLDEQLITVISRKYYEVRDCFDANLDEAEEGIWSLKIEDIPDYEKTCYNIKTNIEHKFKTSLNEVLITGMLDGNLNKDFDNIFEMPRIEKVKDADSELSDENEKITFEDILKPEYEKVIIYGDKEIGKTTFAHYISKYYYDNYNEYKKLAITININSFNLKSTNSIIQRIREEINELSDDSFSVSLNDVKKLLQNDKLVIIFDDCSYEIDLKIINEFIKFYSIKKIYFFYCYNITNYSYSEAENFFDLIQGNEDSKIRLKMLPFSKNQIRKFSGKILHNKEIDMDSLCNKTISCFNGMCLPKTPFAISLFMSICSVNLDFEPTNKSKIVEKFIEILLEKLSSQEKYLKVYGFSSKCTFLSELSYDMYKTNKYYYTKEEFQDFLNEYHSRKKFSIEDTKFDTLFFSKKILVEKNSRIQFRFKCFIFYFLAFYFSKNEKLIVELANSKEYYNFVDLFDYFTGMHNEANELIEAISLKFKEIIEDTPDLNDLLNLENIRDEYFKEEKKDKNCNVNTLSDETRDELSDVDINENYDPQDIDRDKEKKQTEILFDTMSIMGNAIRNSEDLSGELKKEYLDLFSKGALCLIAKIFISFQNILTDFKKSVLEKNEEKDESNKQRLESAFSKFRDIVKIIIPLEMHAFILETTGTAKLKNILLEFINDPSINEFEKFNYVSLYCDLKIENWDTILYEYTNSCVSREIKVILFFKCKFYLRTNYFYDNKQKLKKTLSRLYELNYNKDKNQANNLADAEIRKANLLISTD